MKDKTPRQLQFWDGNAGAYVPAPNEPADPDHARRIADGRGWRIARTDRPLKPRNGWNVHRYRYTQDADAVRRAYVDWAIAKGLASITAWVGRPLPWGFRGIVRYITEKEMFAVDYREDVPRPVLPGRGRNLFRYTGAQA